MAVGNRQRSQPLAKPSASSGWSERGSWLMASICFVSSFSFLHAFWSFLLGPSTVTLWFHALLAGPSSSVSLTFYKTVGLGACTEIIPSEYSSQCLGHPESWLWQSEIIIVENVIIAMLQDIVVLILIKILAQITDEMLSVTTLTSWVW